MNRNRDAGGSDDQQHDRASGAGAVRHEGLPENTHHRGRPMWTDFVPEARMAIAAMRDPTGAIIAAGLRYDVLSGADQMWPDMIDAALNAG